MKWSELKNTPVVSVADATQLGFIDDAYLDPSGQQVRGFDVRRGGLLTHHSATVLADIQAIGKDAVTVRDASALNDANRFSDLGGSLMAEKVVKSSIVTESGDNVGSVGDLDLSDDASTVSALVLTEGLLDRLKGHEHSIPTTDVVSVSDHLVVVKNSAANTSQ